MNIEHGYQGRQDDAVSVVVIIPFYNGSAYIERAIDSVLQQSVQPAEFIIVNDGSDSRESDYIRTLGQKFPFTLVEKENGGQGSARNVGVVHSTARYICFLDQDDMYLHDHIEILYKHVAHTNPRFGWVYGDVWEADGEGAIVRHNLVKSMNRELDSIQACIRDDMHILPSATIIARKAFNEVGGFDERLMGYEDDDLFMRLFRSGFTCQYIPDTVLIWCMHSQSTAFSIKMCRSRSIFFHKLCDLFPDDVVRKRFFFRDFILPRFGDSFLRDVMRCKLTNHTASDEMADNLQACCKRVMNNRFVPYSVRCKYGVALFIIRHFPIPILSLVSRIYVRMAFKRSYHIG